MLKNFGGKTRQALLTENSGNISSKINTKTFDTGIIHTRIF